MTDRDEIGRRFSLLSETLRSSMNEQGFWDGELSPSALATAVSVVALKLGDEERHRSQVSRGMHWLSVNINDDGGFGDTPDSVSNVSATLLCYAAFGLCAPDNTETAELLSRMEHYLSGLGVNITSAEIVKSILGYYGRDYTFSVPILSMLVVCGVLEEEALREIPQLPFELTMLPLPLYRFFNLQVVSYAIPALIAVGIYLFKHKPAPNPVAGFVRRKATGPALVKLEKMMPASGGFLEAIPLTAFVSMCLIRSGYAGHPVVEKGMGFLRNLQRADGSWAIDTNLATWVTTLAINALGQEISGVLTGEQQERLKQYLLENQYVMPHPFNHAEPGGWGWTSFSGAVPDADDTAGAILALLTLDPVGGSVTASVIRGCGWLGSIQNRDGGMPTFCKGWGRLPFDVSCADLTGHALKAWLKTVAMYGASSGTGHNENEIRKLEKHADRALGFLEKTQRPDGSWLPLWFGSQQTAAKTNPVYGTARVTSYLSDALECTGPYTSTYDRIATMVSKARHYLAEQQNDDGSWGAEKGVVGSVEETAVAVSALAVAEPSKCLLGLRWIERSCDADGMRPKPIGLYFATLWYHEKMYPLVHTLEALRHCHDR